MVSPSAGSMTEWEEMWTRAMKKPAGGRSLQDLQVIYYGLSGLEALQSLRDSCIRALCKVVRYEKRQANDVLYYTGELSTCWYILLSGSVFIDGSMFLPRSSFGKRTGGSARRQNECFVLEPSEMIIIDYPDIEQSRRLQHNSPLMDHQQHRPINIMFDDAYMANQVVSRNQQQTGNNLYHKCSRGSHSSDTSSAYSGSDTMVPNNSEMDAEELDLTGLVESVVDSEEEDDLPESMDSLTVRDRIRDCLEKEPNDRNEDDIEALLEFTQHLKAFTNMTLSVRKELCQVMVFAVVEKAGTTVMHDGEELDSWSVLVNGSVEIQIPGKENEILTVGDAFGIIPTMDKLYHQGVMLTQCEDCQFVCITQTDYYRILHEGEENTRKHKNESGQVEMVTELRGGSMENGNRRGHVVIRATSERLMTQLIEENSLSDPTYVEDFLLTHRTFIHGPLNVANQLLEWFKDPDVRDRVTRVVLLWVHNHFTDFETDPGMIEFLETFELGLENEKMVGQLRLLNIACAAKARIRNVTLARPNRDEPLNFQILGGYERNFGIFISKVDKKSKAEDVGLKRGDQIVEVNGQSFEHVSHAKALEILRGTTHLSIAVKSNLLQFKEMLTSPDNSPRPRGRKSEIIKLPPDTRNRLSSVDGNLILSHEPPASQPVTISSPQKEKKPNYLTMGTTKNRFQKALKKMNILPKNLINHAMGCDVVDNVPPASGGPLGGTGNAYQSQSNPDIMSSIFEEAGRCADYPEHVLKIFKPDQTYKYLLVNKETTAHEVVMLALREFGMTDPSSNFSLCEVSVTDVKAQAIRQKRLPEQLQNLAERIGLSSRYYLKTNGVTETLVPDELAPELVRESDVHFLQLNAVEVAIQLTLQDYSIFRQIEPTEYIDELFELKSKYGTPMLEQFAALVNKETFWVVSEVCAEPNPVRRMKIIKQFIKVARQCKELKNFNSMFAIISGLGHVAVCRLRQSWDKLPSKYQRVFSDLQQLMDPSRNMSKYRQLISAEQAQPQPIIPFYPVVRKDLFFIHLGNDSKMDGLINFEKLRMIAKEVRSLSNMCNRPYDLFSMWELGGQPASNAMVALNQLTTASSNNYLTQGQSTVKRRKKSTAAPNPKKMFEESQMVRRVKAYLNNLQVETDEAKLHELSLECEPAAVPSSTGAGNTGSQRGKRHASPAPSTTSSTSSASDERKPTAKFGSASPQAVRKLLALSEPSKARPHQPRAPPSGLATIPGAQPSPNVRRAPSATGSYSSYGSGHSSGSSGRPVHERSHSDTPPPLPSVALSAESSSVTSLTALPLRKTLTSGSVTSSDSGHSTISQVTTSSVDGHTYQPRCNSPTQNRLPPVMGWFPPRTGAIPPYPHAVAVLPPLPSASVSSTLRNNGPSRRQPPTYSVAAQMAKLQRLGRAHSHEGVTQGYHYHNDPDTDQDDEETQVSAV